MTLDLVPQASPHHRRPTLSAQHTSHHNPSHVSTRPDHDAPPRDRTRPAGTHPHHARIHQMASAAGTLHATLALDENERLQLSYLERTMSLEHAADELNVSRATVYRLLHRGVALLAAALPDTAEE